MSEEFIEHVIINDGAGVVVTSLGEVVPITNYLDWLGDECEPDGNVTAVVAGPDRNGKWWSVDLSGFENLEAKDLH